MTRRDRTRPRKARGRSLVGERYTLRTERIAHGGFVVGRHEGRAVFVRHALPGERVVVEVTEGYAEDRFLRADAVEVLEASPDRVEPPCPYAGPGLCGGCDFQHVALPAQRGLKAAVVAEQLQRLAGLEVDVEVEPLPGAGADDGLGWRTRVQWAVDEVGTVGLRRARSHDVVRVERCLIAHPDVADAPVEVLRADEFSPVAVETIVSGTGEHLQIAEEADGSTYVDAPELLHERAAGRTWQVTGSGFWQVHPAAADTLVGAVLDGLDPQPGESALDLYSGVGLFSGAIGERVGRTGRVVAVEGDQVATDDAVANLGDLPQVEPLALRVDHALSRAVAGDHVDLVVLDPPRTGAKRPVVEGVVALTPRAVAYVACDPAALARDVAIFAEHGYALTGLRAFDLFPMTQHVECVAHLVKSDSRLR